jgi:tRNA(Ile)-lysidine synthase
MPKKTLSRMAAVPKRGELAERLCLELRKGELTQAGLRVGVAVSGGADSVALLLLLLELREQLGIVLSVVHFNHKLRGKASGADEKFVAKLAAQHGLPFFAEHEDIAGKAKRERANLEDAARRGRYTFFEGLVLSGQLDRVAVAHTADDQAETVLAHILRGTGLAGLGGIHPVAGCVFRPLLRIRRAELRAYLRSRHQAWREDATNRDTKRMRARIRRRLIPLLEKQFQPAAVEHLSQLAELAREDDAWLEDAAELRVAVSAKQGEGEWRIAVADLLSPQVERETYGSGEQLRSRRAAQALSKRIIRLLAKKVKPRSGQLSAVHVDAVLQLAQYPDSGKSLHLPGGVEVRRQHDALCFRPMIESSAAKCPPTAYCYAVNLGSGQAELRLPEQSCGLRFTVIDWPPEGRETKLIGAVLDREVLSVPLVVRNWWPGDALRPLGHQKHHKLSRLLNELGVSRWDKVSWPVLVSGGRVAWTRGLPVAAEFAAGSSTRVGVVVTEVPLTE